MNSRQNLRPVGSDRWITNTASAVKKATSDNFIIVTSVGMNSWEISLYFASRNNADLLLYIPAEKDNDLEFLKSHYIKEFALEDNKIEWRFIFLDNIRRDYDKFQSIRDEQIVSMADLIYPIAIRPDGNLERHLKKTADSEVEINESFACQYDTPPKSYKYIIEEDLINPELDSLASDYIIHWTRASNSPWPGESLFEYYDGIVKSSDNYSRDARSTLTRILSEKSIRASSRHYRKNMAAVSFSSLAPSEAVKLMRWRARYREMSFEPYGIGIKNKAAKRLGIRKVLYGNPEMYRYLDPDDLPYFQSIGSRGFWLPEREFRLQGDLDLELLEVDDLIVIVWKPDEISQLKSIFDGKIVSFYK